MNRRPHSNCDACVGRSIPSDRSSSRDRLLTAARLLLIGIALCSIASFATAQMDYSRPVNVAPDSASIGAGYQPPVVQRTSPRAAWLFAVDVVVLTGMLIASALVAHRWRRRWMATALTLLSLGYFGFYRQGCVCPVGSVQNVATALFDSGYVVPMVVLAFFLLPLIAALVAGRVFCGGACPLGAIQDVVLLRPVEVPKRVDRWLGKVPYIYLALAIWFAILPADRRDFIICRFDPFVGFFRFAGSATMLAVGVALLSLATVVGRPYCRYLCPYGALLGIVSRVAWKPIRITPDEELDCGLCTEACPYGAIENMRAIRSRCVACARCFAHCPRQQLAWGEIEYYQLENIVSNAKASAGHQEPVV